MNGIPETITFFYLLGVFGLGVATSFTPCVLPLVPVVVGVIGAAGEGAWRRRLLLSGAYVFGLALVYAALGVTAALTGRFFGEIQARPLTGLVVGLLFIVFGLAMLGFIRLPTAWLNRLGAGRRFRGGGLAPVFLMGAASGFLAAPCTVPITGALLAWVAATGSVVTGFALFLAFALGMGAILLVAGTMTGLPTAFGRARRWTPVVQKILAGGLLAAGTVLTVRGLQRLF